MASCYTLASVTASTPRLDWIDVCTYSDPTGYTCCPPGMENKEYLVVPEDHDWFGHSQACRSEYFTGQHSHWSVSLEILSFHWSTDDANTNPSNTLILAGSTAGTEVGWPCWRRKRRRPVSSITSSLPMTLHSRDTPSA